MKLGGDTNKAWGGHVPSNPPLTTPLVMSAVLYSEQNSSVAHGVSHAMVVIWTPFVLHAIISSTPSSQHMRNLLDFYTYHTLVFEASV